MFVRNAIVTQAEIREGHKYWIEVEIEVPEDVFAVELTMENFPAGAESSPLSNLFVGTHHLTVEGQGPLPLRVGDTTPATCFAEAEINQNI